MFDLGQSVNIRDDLREDLLTEDHYEVIQTFKCGDESSVETFLKEEALSLQRYNMAITRLFFDGNQNLVGYFTVFNDMLQRIGRDKRKKLNWDLISADFYPAIRIHYLGVDERYRGQGNGTTIMLSAIDLCHQTSKISGCSFITIEALDSSVEFYRRFDFKTLGRPTSYYYNMALKIDELD
ncbi:GNAT family N-acetyltransferase [Bacillus songklensis]|uniref:GNAT family N-acetyltransferase n=1 Tax=Bacillus songklensis TaxID=1069116 RepID=A0ABV8B2K0_9BACI